MRFDWKRQLCFGIAGMMLLLPKTALALYSSEDNDTGINRLDYIENQKRIARENALTDEQKQLQQDMLEMRAKRKTPLDPTKPSPATFEGDEIFYDMKSGDAFAQGHVRVTQEEGRRFIADEAKGNLKTHDIYVEDKTNLLQLVPAQTRVRLEGFRTEYNYDKKTGKMFNADGKVGNHYVKGKKIEFYPDRVIIYKGTATKCGAKKPDYHMRAEKIEVFPNDIMVLYDIDFYIGRVHVYHKDRHTVDISGSAQPNEFPRFGYDSDDGVWVEQSISMPLAKNAYIDTTLKYLSKQGVRSNGDIRWGANGHSTRLYYGYYEDSNERWLKKEPSFTYSYGRAIPNTGFSFSVGGEIGRWNQTFKNGMSKRSTHKYYGISLSHRPINLIDNLKLYLSGSYGVTKESYDKSTSKGFSYSALLMKDISPMVTVYAGYHYSATNSTNTVFSYDLDDYSRKLDYGISFRVTDRDRFVVGQYYDCQAHRQRKTEYYWFHDMHCAQLILRYKTDRPIGAKREGSWHISLQFTPW